MKDLEKAPRLELDWSPEHAQDSLQKVFDFVMEAADEAIGWYSDSKRTKKSWARRFRMAAIILGALAALLPTIGDIFSPFLPSILKSLIGAGGTVVLGGIVATLLLLDKFFGFSTGWMRYISAELQLRQMEHEFQLEWQTNLASWEGKAPNTNQILQMMGRCKVFVTQVDNCIREETNAWIKEFEKAIQEIDESVKMKTTIPESGVLNLTVINGDSTDDGWTLAIDNGSPEPYKGKTAGKRNLLPGPHEVKVEGKISGKTVRAEKVFTVKPGGACEETLTLS